MSLTLHYYKMTEEIELCCHLLKWKKIEHGLKQDDTLDPDPAKMKIMGNPVVTDDKNGQVVAIGFGCLVNFLRQHGIALPILNNSQSFKSLKA